MSKISPMTMMEALEAIKILAPLAPILNEPRTMNVKDMVRATLVLNSNEMSVQNFRLLALMMHVSIDEIIDQFQHLEGHHLALALGDCFSVNPLPDLLSAGRILGLVNEGSQDA